MSAQERMDLIENRSTMVKSMLDALLCAMQADCPVGSDTVENVIWAASELLSVPEVVA